MSLSTPELKQRTDKKPAEGQCHPLGATLAAEGVNFALYSQTSTEVFLLLFDALDADPADIIRMEGPTRYIWHVFVPGLRAGQLYGYKVRGDFRPGEGLRFNEGKLLIDPCAKALTHKFRNTDNLLLAYDPLSPERDLSLDLRDNARTAPKSIVIDDAFDWRGDAPPRLRLEELVIYETHVKGFTAHASSGVRSPGSYLGFIEKIPYLKNLGVNAVELMPVHEFYIDDFLAAKGLTNYWGYNTIAFFAPESSYAAGSRPGCQVEEFKTLVRELHKAGIQVILDVVYNHTAEGNELGPTMCFRGVDNKTYYVLAGDQDHEARYYMNFTGCGNSINITHPQVVRLIMDSLRYWVSQMHVDGFRFDLASVLGREAGGYQKSASFFDAVSQDPLLSRVLFIAEPWDLGTYQVGNFPVDWSEWNGLFRDTMRRFIRGDPGQLGDLGRRVTGSPDLYGDDGRSPYNSVNFITCHDGFTLYDLVSYDGKRNEANGEANNDGANDNLSWNCGAEGETDDEDVLALRRKLVKNHACALLFSCGTPMILVGDEFLRSQRGNNNAYCQDNETSWYDWGLAVKNADILDFFRKAIAFTRRHPALQRRKFLSGLDLDGDAVADITWFGKDLDPPDWSDAEGRTLCYMLDGGESGVPGDKYFLFFILNADSAPQGVRLPVLPGGRRWHRVIDTSLPAGLDILEQGKELPLDHGGHYLANPQSTIVLVSR